MLSFVFVLIPTFKHFRILSILGIVGTAWTAVYIWIVAGIHGLGSNWSTGPNSLLVRVGRRLLFSVKRLVLNVKLQRTG